MQNKIKLGMIACVLSVSLVAHAGYQEKREVKVDPNAVGGPTASGSIGAARASADSNQYIGCAVSASRNGSNPSYLAVNCWAVDKDKKTGQCHSKDPAIIAAAQALTANSFISFIWDQRTEECLTLSVSTVSLDLPAQP